MAIPPGSRSENGRFPVFQKNFVATLEGCRRHCADGVSSFPACVFAVFRRKSFLRHFGKIRYDTHVFLGGIASPHGVARNPSGTQQSNKKDHNMKTNVLMFKTHKVENEVISEQPFWVAKPILNASVSIGQVAQAVAESRGVSTEDVLYILRRASGVVVEMLKSGRNVNLELVGFSINLNGAFSSKDDSFRQSRNALRVSAYAKPVLRDCLKDVRLRNVTGGLKASVFSITDDAARIEGVVTVASKVLVAGIDILIDAEHADEGVWILDGKGNEVAMPTVIDNTVGTLDLDLGELPPDGEYTLVVKARSGASTDYAPATVRRNFTVRRG